MVVVYLPAVEIDLDLVIAAELEPQAVARPVGLDVADGVGDAPLRHPPRRRMEVHNRSWRPILLPDPPLFADCDPFPGPRPQLRLLGELLPVQGLRTVLSRGQRQGQEHEPG